MSKETFIEKYWGHDLYDNFDAMNIDYEVGFHCNKLYYNYVDRVKLYPSSRQILEKLSNYKKGIITNTPKNSAEKVLKYFDIYKYFQTVMTSDDVKMGKPNPEIILKSCKKLNVKPKDIIIIGDTQSDIIAAKKAGSKIIGVNVVGDFQINDLSELENYFLII